MVLGLYYTEGTSGFVQPHRHDEALRRFASENDKNDQCAIFASFVQYFYLFGQINIP
jgi:hypothetical protein